MDDVQPGGFAQHWREIVSAFLKLGATAYGGPAIMGILQAELQEKRRWTSRERFVEGLSLANLLPGASVTQLGIFLGYVRGGWWGGLLGGLCFIVPGFYVMLALTMLYASVEATAVMRGGIYGLGPVVLAIFIVAIYRLGRTTVRALPHAIVGVAAALAAALTPLGTAAILGLAAGLGIWHFHSKRLGALVLAGLAASIVAVQLAYWSPLALVTPLTPGAEAGTRASLADIAAFFLEVGALTFGGGLTMIPFIEDQVVDQFRWISHQEFLGGLALGQFTPGPVVVVAAYVGYKVAGIAGAVAAALAIFTPSFVLMLAVLPIFERVKRLAWIKAATEGLGPAVIGVLAVSLIRLAPHALPDPFAVALLAGTLVALLSRRVGTLKVMLAGGILGVLRNRVSPLAGVRVPLA